MKMKEKTLYIIWGCLFILCAALGFIPEIQGFGKAVLVIISILFFVPGVQILRRAIEKDDCKAKARVRRIAAGSLVLTMLLIIANFLTINASETVGNILYALLVIGSSPMICSQYWVLSLFLWACLLFGSFTRSKKA